MRRLVVALLVLLLPASAMAIPSRALDTAPKEIILHWINKYRHNPDVERVPSAMRGLSRLGLLSDPEGAGVYVGFLAGILVSNPDKADALIARIFPLPGEQHWAIVRAIAYSGLSDWQGVLRRAAERMPARRVMIEKFLDSKLPTLEQAPIEKDPTWGERMRGYMPLARHFERKSGDVVLDLTPDLLDTLWGYFYATGSDRPLSRMVLMLRWSKEQDSLERLTLGNMAKYTLAINSARNPDLLARLKWIATQPQREAVKPMLKEVIDAAETAETAKLRGEALATIDELKRKGPGMKRELSLWAQVGEGALAIGCIAAAVAGQVEFGVPCVIGGVATSAALRLWDGQK